MRHIFSTRQRLEVEGRGEMGELRTESKIGSKESGVWSREVGDGRRESGVGRRETGDVSPGLGIRSFAHSLIAHLLNTNSLISLKSNEQL